MKRVLIIAFALLAACKPVDDKPADDPAAKGGPPPIPPYQMRAELPSGDRLVAGRDGEALFSNRCGACHLEGGMGTNLVRKQQMMAGNGPEAGLIANRDDLTIAYVKTVVRQGKNAMPPQTRVDLTDAELDAVANYLAKGKP